MPETLLADLLKQNSIVFVRTLYQDGNVFFTDGQKAATNFIQIEYNNH